MLFKLKMRKKFIKKMSFIKELIPCDKVQILNIGDASVYFKVTSEDRRKKSR